MLGFSEDGYSAKAVDRRLSIPYASPFAGVLDIGGARGIDAGPLSKLAKFGVVIDLDKRQLLSGKSTSKNVGLGSCIDYILATAEHLPFQNESFGLVTCFSVIDHLPSKERAREAVLEMSRVVMWDGFVSITIPNKLFLVGTVSMGLKRLLDRYVERRFTPKELRDLLVQAKLRPTLYDCSTSNRIGDMVKKYNMPEIITKVHPAFFEALARSILACVRLLGSERSKLLGARFGILSVKVTEESSHE